jgi:hypothetical protein
MADQTPPSASASGVTLVVAPEVMAKFGETVELIKRSESMNDEERQYWVGILPSMTPEQLKNLQDILQNERKQLAAIDAKYSKELDSAGQQEAIRRTSEQRRKRREERSASEASHRMEESKQADALLGEISSM